VLTSDGARHRRLRGVLQRPLGPAALKERRGFLKSLIAAQIDTLTGVGTFDAVPGLARHLPLKAVTVLVGLGGSERERMLEWAATFFDMVKPFDPEAPRPPELDAQFEIFRELSTFFATVDPKSFAPDSWSAKLFEAVGPNLSEEEARGALRAFVVPSLDTTIYAKANLLYNLAQNPDQWATLKRQPSLIPRAVIEGVRHSAVVRAFSRFAAADYREGDVFIPKGRRVMVMYGSANRDERHYPDPDRFDITRNPTDQLGWGTGPHMCVGMNLAKLEMEVLLEALVERVSWIEADEPTLGTNAGLYGLDRLPLRLGDAI
jgi:cytochrome P450